MSRLRANSSPNLLPSSEDTEQSDDSSLEGVAATVKLLLKLVQDHKEACGKEQNDSRRMLRVAGMMTILDNIKNRMQKCQSFGKKKELAELRRCNTDVRGTSYAARDKRPAEPVYEREKLRRELSASLAARKSLEVMCSSLGKEKEIMAAELARKVQELTGIEELVKDLRAQNETLLGKVQEYAEMLKEKKCGGGGGSGGGRGGGGDYLHGNVALQDRNKTLSEQLLRSLDGCRSAKRKLKDAQEENLGMRATMREMGAEVGAALERIRSGWFKQQLAMGSDGGEGLGKEGLNIEDEISKLEHMLECFELKVTKHAVKKGECVKPRGDISTCKPSVLA